MELSPSEALRQLAKFGFYQRHQVEDVLHGSGKREYFHAEEVDELIKLAYPQFSSQAAARPS